MIKFAKITKTFVSAIALCGVVAIVTVLPVFTGNSGQAFAATDKENLKYDERKTRKTPGLSQKIYKVLSEAQVCAEANDYVCAEKTLDDGLGSKLDKLNSYERAQYYNMKAYLYFIQEDTPSALKAYENVLKQENLPAAMEDQTLYQMAQLYFMAEDYLNSIKMMNRWLEYQPAPTAQALEIMGQAYFSLGIKDNTPHAKAVGYFNQSIPYIQQAIALYKDAGKEPKENWYLLLRAMYFEMKENQKVLDVLEILITHWPKKDYWLQLGGMYGEMSSDAKSEKVRTDLEKKQLATYEAAYYQGFLLRSSELINMSQLYMYHEIPYWASVVLKKGLKAGIIEKNSKNFERLAQAQLNAQDWKDSLVPLRQAAELSEDGELYRKLGTVYLQLDDYANGAKYFGLALKKGGLKRVDTTLIYEGMCYFNLGELDKARKSFELAAKDKRSTSTAHKWISYLASERKRQREIKEYLG